MDIAKRIFDLVDQSGLEQKKFAELVGTTDKTVSAWRTGRSKSYTKYFAEIAQVLGTTTEYLTSGNEVYKTPEIFKEFQIFLAQKDVQREINDVISDSRKKSDALHVLGLGQEAYSVALAYQRTDNEHKRIVRSTLALEDMPFPAEFEHTDEAM